MGTFFFFLKKNGPQDQNYRDQHFDDRAKARIIKFMNFKGGFVGGPFISQGGGRSSPDPEGRYNIVACQQLAICNITMMSCEPAFISRCYARD